MSKKNKRRESVTPYQATQTADGYLLWDTRLIQPNPRQPRKYFDPEKMEALKKSIKRKGILTPLRIAPYNIEGNARLVDGERRFRAATELALTNVPVILSPTSKDPRRLFEESVIANFCREDMTEIEIARALQQLMEQNDYNQSDVAELVGKTAGWVSNMLKFLKLHPTVADRLAERKISPSMALAVSRYDKNHQPDLADGLQKAQEEKGRALTVQEVAVEINRRAAKSKVVPQKPKKGKLPETNPDKLQVNLLLRQIKNTTPEVDGVLAISDAKLALVSGEPLILLEQEIDPLIKKLQKLSERLRVVI